MVRRVLALTLMLALLALGLPNLATAAPSHDQVPHSHAAMHDCVCPPGHEMPQEQDDHSCAPTLACMIHCGMVAMAMPVVAFAGPAALPAFTPVFAQAAEPRTPSVAPPFRPPAR
jgi:hypothetical protein